MLKISLKTRNNMMKLLGMMTALQYPLAGPDSKNDGYYDLVDNCKEVYEKIIFELIGYENE